MTTQKGTAMRFASCICPTLATGESPFARRLTRTTDWCQTVARRTRGALYHAKKDDLAAPGDAV